MRVSVKLLCAFAAKAGDLDLRFAPAPTAHEGIAGHRLVQGRREADYESEVSLTAVHDGLQVRGRADGYDPALGRVEEIKTFRGDFDAVKPNHRALHWAQARCYAAMLCEARALDRIEIALVYLEIATGEEFVLTERGTRAVLRGEFESLCTQYLGWARQEADRSAALDVALAALAFPHPNFRHGQRELARAVYRAATSERPLLAQAPTGIGKTLATLFPLLMARPSQRLDKIFFLTAKTSGRAVALAALRRVSTPGAPLRVLELVARDKACEHPTRACHGDACPLARGFYDRLPAARQAAADAAWLDREALRRTALAHEVCPYYLGQEMARWCDVVVGDYNYYFDGSAFLYALTRAEEWRVAVLVDEAHNLLARARGMYSAELTEDALAEARRAAPASVFGALERLAREAARLRRGQRETYRAFDALDEGFERAVQDSVGVLAEHFASRPQEAHGPLQAFFFEALHFARLIDSFGTHSVFESTLAIGSDAEPGRGSISHDPARTGAPAIRIRNLVPAPFLAPRFAAASGCTCFSATLAPFAFHRDTLGLPADTRTIDVGTPFRAEQLAVRVATDVSTRFHDRGRSLGRVVGLMAAQFASRPGNYLAFFSSFDYLARASASMAQRHPAIPTWSQRRDMDEAARTDFLARFEAGGRGIAFAVLGGAFGEGIDLPGDRLIGAFVASLGLPQHDAANEVMRARMQAMFGNDRRGAGGDGYDYTYLYPGLQKVVQAAGRVIRTPEDCGVLHLMDDRFARPEVQALLPAWWVIESASGPPSPSWPAAPSSP